MSVPGLSLSALRITTPMETAVSAEVARVGVAPLADRAALEHAVAERYEAAAAGCGTQLVRVDVLEIKLDLDSHLVDWADRRAGAPGAR